MKLAYYKVTGSPSQSSTDQMQERGFLSCTSFLLELKPIPDLNITTEILLGVTPLSSLCPLCQNNYQVVSSTQ